jgi:hypothetical protein
LHRYQSVVDEDFFGEEVGAYRCFVACGEFLVYLGKDEVVSRRGCVWMERRESYVLVHQAGFADAAVA